MSSDSHSDDHSHDSHDSHAHPVATDVIPESSVQDLGLKGLTIVAAALLYFMAFSWMGVPLPEAGHEAGPALTSEHGEQSGTSVHSAPEHVEGHH